MATYIKTLAAGEISTEAHNILTKYGATIETMGELKIISFPTGTWEEGANWAYQITLPGTEDKHQIIIYLDVDSSKTTVTLSKY